MTPSTQTAPISTDQRSAIKNEIAQLIADSKVRLPEGFGCDQTTLAAIEESLDTKAYGLLKQVPSDDRRSVLALAVVRATAIRKEAAVKRS